MDSKYFEFRDFDTLAKYAGFALTGDCDGEWEYSEALDSSKKKFNAMNQLERDQFVENIIKHVELGSQEVEPDSPIIDPEHIYTPRIMTPELIEYCQNIDFCSCSDLDRKIKITFLLWRASMSDESCGWILFYDSIYKDICPTIRPLEFFRSYKDCVPPRIRPLFKKTNDAYNFRKCRNDTTEQLDARKKLKFNYLLQSNHLLQKFPELISRNLYQMFVKRGILRSDWQEYNRKISALAMLGDFPMKYKIDWDEISKKL